MADPTADKYAPAYQVYLQTGNLSEAARRSGVNESSLREFAGRRGWKGDLEKHRAANEAMLEQAAQAVPKIVTSFYARPSAAKAKLAREALDIERMIGGGTVAGEVQARCYSGDKEGYKDLLISQMVAAQRAGRHGEVRQYLEMLGQLDGHIQRGAEKTGGGASLPPIDFSGLESLGSEDGPVHAGFEEGI